MSKRFRVEVVRSTTTVYEIDLSAMEDDEYADWQRDHVSDSEIAGEVAADIGYEPGPKIKPLVTHDCEDDDISILSLPAVDPEAT